MISTSNTTAPTPATPACHDLDRVLERSEELRVRVHGTIEAEKATHWHNTGGLRVVPLYCGLRHSVSAERARELAEGYRRRPEGVEADDEGAGEIASEILYAADSVRGLHRAPGALSAS